MHYQDMLPDYQLDQPDWDEGMDSQDGYAEVFPSEPEPDLPLGQVAQTYQGWWARHGREIPADGFYF